ncbi:MAG: acetyltransferase [Lactobacillales bacterium]|jgi:peptidoglycan/LPS O-acetylase OafA/YrhL|nr:acetyltransferase [Lactobacillales bacterium]
MENKHLAKARYITGFDGIRTIAVIGVILYHLAPNVMKGGYLGVPVFFVLSGYLITDLLRQEFAKTKKIDVIGFYERRMKRLYPGLVAMLVLSSAYITLFQQNLLNNLRGVVISSLTYMNNWWQIAKGESYFNRFANESPFSHIWSLAVEGQYYFVWPLLFLLLVKLLRNGKKIFQWLFVLSIFSAVLMAVLFHPGQDPTRVYYGTDTRLFSIFLGSALAFIWPSWHLKEEVPPETKKTLNIIGAVAVVLLILSFFFLGDNLSFVYRGGLYLVSLVSMVAVAITAHPGASWNKWLTNPVFTYLGKRSYGIYLWQFPVMIFYEAKIGNVGNHVWLHTLVELVLIFGISELSYRFVEQPLKRFDYTMTFSKMKSYFSSPFNEPKKIAAYITMLVSLVALVGVVIAPTNSLTADQKDLQKTIEKNAKKAEEHQKEVAKDEEAGIPVTLDPNASFSERYDLSEAQVKAASKIQITAFGDSVMLASAASLQDLFPYMYLDADVGRQLYDSYDALQKLKDDGKLADIVLVSLGTNGQFTSQQLAQFMDIIGKDREVYWLTAHVPTKRWQNTVNSLLKTEEKNYENLHLIDWEKESADKPDWFYKDNVHPNETGIPYYTKLIAKSILNKTNVKKVNEETKKSEAAAKKETSSSSTTTSESK